MEDITVEKKVINGKLFYNIQLLTNDNLFSFILDKENFNWLNNMLNISK